MKNNEEYELNTIPVQQRNQRNQGFLMGHLPIPITYHQRILIT